MPNKISCGILLLLACSPGLADIHRIATVDSAGVKSHLFLRSYLEPSGSEVFPYLDSNLRVDSIAAIEFRDLGPSEKVQAKYGRLLGLSLTKAALKNDISLQGLKDGAKGDTTFQVRVMKAYEAEIQRKKFIAVSAGAGLIAGVLIYEIALLGGVDCIESSKGPIGECKTVDVNSVLAASGAAISLGLGAAGVFYLMRFDEEIAAQKIFDTFPRLGK